MAARPKLIRMVHTMRGRTRLRLPWLRGDPEQAREVADAFAELEGIIEVEVRPRTGSVLLHFDPSRLDNGAILKLLGERTGVWAVLQAGERHHSEIEEIERAAHQQGAGTATQIARAFRSINVDLLRVTDGHVDLPLAAATTLLAMGVADIVSSKKIPSPPWFNLAWWAFRTFTTMEKKAIELAEDPRVDEVGRPREERVDESREDGHRPPPPHG